MPTWGEVLEEIKLQVNIGAIAPFDVVRRRHLANLHAKTGRNTILYSTNWGGGGAGVGDPQATSITPDDVHGFMEVVNGLSGDELDLVVHSPGGSAEATEALVSYLRAKFNDIRVVVPHAAMSAATMLACAADRLLLGKHSFLGPIDPQVIVQTEQGTRSVPAYAIIEQFERAKREVKADPGLLPAWLPILRQYGPAMIVQCQLHQKLAEELVSDWLARFMFRGQKDAVERAGAVARFLSNHEDMKSHSRFIPRDQLRALRMTVEDLEDDQTLQDCVLSVFHATSHTFNATPVAKIIENHRGKAFVKMVTQPQMMMLPPGVQLPPGIQLPQQARPPKGP